MSNTPVSPVVEMLIDGTWTDILDDVRLGDADSGGGIDITRGTPNEGNAAEPTQVNFVLNNAGGKYSPKNPYSENYGKLGRNTPVRIALSRRTDDFDRTESDSWGRMPSWTDTENETHLGDRWQVVGTSSAFDITPGAATIQAATGYRMALFGTYGDVEIYTKVKVSDLTSEFGIVMRAADVDVGTDAGDFESGLGTWVAYGGTSTLQISTTQFHTGTQSLLLTVSGSPASTYPRCDGAPVTPGHSYRARMWVRCSISTTITASIDYLDADSNYISGGYNGVAVTADTWTVMEVTATAPDDAAFGSYGANLGGSPANGTLMWMDDVEFLDLTQSSFYTAYITPGSPDQLRLGTIDVATGRASAVSQNQSENVVAGDWWHMRAQMSGIRRRVRWWKDGDPEPTTWNWRTYETARETSTSAVPPMVGRVGLFAKDGTALVTFEQVQVTVWRAHAEIAELPPRWDLSRRDRWVPIAARGILRRLGQGRKALESPVTLHLENYTTSKMWIPLESVDGDAISAGNRIAGGADAITKNLSQGTVDTTGEFAAPGIGGCAVLDANDSYLIARALPGAAAGIWSLMCFLRVPSAVASDCLLYTVESSGTAKRYFIWYTSGGGLRVEARSDSNTILSQNNSLVYFSPEIPQGSWVAANLYVFESGGTVSWAWNFHKPGTEDFFTINSTHAGTAGTFREVHFYSNSLLTAAGNLQIAHVFHYPGDLPFVTYDFARAAYAYFGEEAVSRYLRLTANAGVKATTTGYTSESKALGYQTASKLLDLLDECAQADDSILMEERDDFGLNMRTRESLWNQTPLDLSIDDGHLSEPLDPTADDQRTRNDVTVRRPNGGFYRSVQTEGPLNVNAPEDDVDGVGTYDESVELNYHTVDQLAPAANWRRSKGTIDESRYPQIKADLASSAYQDDAALTAELLAKDSGDVITVLNTEVDYRRIEQMIQQYTEHLDQYEHTLSFVAIPAAPWRVGVVGSTTRLGTRYQFLDGAFDAGTDVRLSAEVVGRPAALPYDGLWVQVADSPESFPFEIEIEGCRLSVHATGDVLNGNGYFDSGIDGWVGVDATLYWDRYPGQYKSGVGALRIIGTVAASYNWAEVDATLRATVVAGEDYQVSAWLMTDEDTVLDTAVDIDWFDASDTYLSTSSTTAVSTTAYEWVHVTGTHTAPVGAVYARPVPYTLFASVGDLLWADDVRIMPVSSFEASPQTLSVDQTPTNGVEKTLTDGAAISVVDPWRVAF